MRILLINDYSSLEGGAERSILALRERLRDAGHDARLFSSDAHSPNLTPQADNLCRGSMNGKARTLLQTCNPWAVRSLRRVLNEFQPHVVHVQMFLTQLSPFILPLLRGYPTLYHAAWLRAVCPLGTKYLPNGKTCTYPVGIACRREGCLNKVDWLLRMVQHRLLLRWRNAFMLTVANSHFTRFALEDHGFDPVLTIYNGTDTIPQRPPLTDPPTAIFAGRVIRSKGVLVLLEAFRDVVAEIPNARLIIAGQGEELSRLKFLTAVYKLNDNVTFTGFLEPDELERVAASAWVQVVPTLNAEPFGLVAAEAAMRGTAVIASFSGGLIELIHNTSNGYLFPPGDAHALARMLQDMLEDREGCEYIGSAARKYALENYTQEIFLSRFLQVYEAMTSRRVQ